MQCPVHSTGFSLLQEGEKTGHSFPPEVLGLTFAVMFDLAELPTCPCIRGLGTLAPVLYEATLDSKPLTKAFKKNL